MKNVDHTITLVRAFANSRGWKPSRFAKEAGLGVNTLSGMNREDWNPSADTLRRLESLIPEGWSASEATEAA